MARALAGFGGAAGVGCLLLSCPMVGLLNRLGSMPPKLLNSPAIGSPLPRPDAMMIQIKRTMSFGKSVDNNLNAFETKLRVRTIFELSLRVAVKQRAAWDRLNTSSSSYRSCSTLMSVVRVPITPVASFCTGRNFTFHFMTDQSSGMHIHLHSL